MNAQALANITRRSMQDMEGWVAPLLHVFERFEINTQERRAMFLAQIALESAGFKRLEENLNYSAKRLVEVFPTHFRTLQDAKLYAGNPEMIANRVYRNRYGNGAEHTGDGYRYRGRGLKQLTFKENYERCGKGLNLDLVNNPDLLLQPEYAAFSAGWFWNTNNLSRYADRNDIENCTRRINGGLNGLDDRKTYWERAKKEVLV